jgi:DNA-binding MarR family transcriptional regulator/ribosomal protein S18 acetylase RimI-like enzyme
MPADPIRQMRRFNRTVGETLGVTGDQFLGRKRPPGESRLLWEIGVDGIAVRLLRRRLGLDSGYVSRVLQSLARQGLVRVRPDAADGRVRRASVTARGAAERAHLDRRSDALAADLLAPLSAHQQQRLIAAMTDVERLLRASMVRFVVADPKSVDAQSSLRQYFHELEARFAGGFDPSRSLSADAADLISPRGVLLLGYAREHPVACGALKFHRRAPAEVKRMWIDRDYRGLGLGTRILTELERRARRAGVRRLHLETNDALVEAIGLYRRSGYTEVEPFNDEPYADHWFEKRLTPQHTTTRSRRHRS